MSAVHEIILKDGPAPKATSTAMPSTPMPAHNVTNRTPKKPTGRLTGRNGSVKSPASGRSKTPRARGSTSTPKRSPNKRKRVPNFDDSDNDEADENEEVEFSKKHELVVGNDFGMSSYGFAQSSRDKDPSTVSENLNWRGSDLNQFKVPSVVAFKKDNPDHPAFRDVQDCLVGLDVPTDAVKCSFFKASLDKRAKPSKFDHPILQEEIAKSLVSFNTPEEDERAALAVLRSLYEYELENTVESLTEFDSQRIENTKFTFVFTHPAACTREGRETLEQLAQAAGFASRPGDEIKLLSEAQAAAMASFISYQDVEKHAVWQKYFKTGNWITVLDIGSLTVDTTTEEILTNDPRLTLKEMITSEGGRCGIVTLHLMILDKVMRKFKLKVSDLPHSLVGRDTDFNRKVETLVRNFTGKSSTAASRLPLRLPEGTKHPDYDRAYGGEIILKIDELKEVFEEYIEYVKKLLQDQWNRALKKKHKVKTTIICGGGSLVPFVWNTLSQFCEDQNVKAVRPKDPISAACRGAVISQLSDGLLGQRMLRAHFGIKLEVDGEIVMKWIKERGDGVDTRSPRTVGSHAGHFSLNIEQVLNQGAVFELNVYTYETDEQLVTDPDHPDIKLINKITIDRDSMSKYYQKILEKRLTSLDSDAREEASIDIDVLLNVDDSGRLYFQVKSGQFSLGRGELRFDSTRRFN